MSDINPNTPVTEASGDVSNGDGPLTFDELESVLAKPKASKVSREAKDDMPAEVDAKIKMEPKESKKDDDGETEKKTEKKESGEKEAKELEKAQDKARKVLKAKLADKEFELDEDAVVPVKINGKEELVPVKELLGNYSGKVAWDKKFSEIGETQKQIKLKESTLSEQKSKIKQIFDQEDPQLRLFKMAELAGVTPVEFRQKFLDENIKLLEKWNSMSDDERKADALAFENSYLKHKQETLTKENQTRQASEALDKKIQGLRQTHNVDQNEFVDRYDQIETLVNSGKLGQDKLSPEFVIETIEKDRLWNAAADVVSKLGWPQQQQNEKLLRLVDDAYHAGIKPKDIPDIVSELWGSKKSQKVVSEKVKERTEFISGKKDSPAIKPSSEVLMFDDIM